MAQSVCRKILGPLLLAIFLSGSFCHADPDVIFIGAGPVGLYTAIQAKLYNPEMKIHFFEKYKTYQRKHTVLVNKQSFKNAHNDLEFQEILTSFGKLVRTAVLEEKLLQLAANKGITIQHQEIKSVAEIVQLFPNTKIIVGSDGSHSMARENFIPKEKLKSQDLSHLVEIKYDVLGDTRGLSIWKEAFPLLTKVNHTVMEYVGKRSDDGKTPVALRVLR